MPLREPEVSWDAPLLRRMLEFELETCRLAGDVLRPVEGGQLLLSPRAPLLHDADCLIVEEAGRPAGEIARQAERVLLEEQLTAITVGPLDPLEGERLSPDFERLGWEVERGVYMLQRRGPDRAAEHPVRELRGDELGGFFPEMMREIYASDYEGDPAEVTDQFVTRERGFAASGGDRWFVAEDPGGAPASCCYLIERDGLGQVENVATSPNSRDRGFARAVVLAAIQASRASGNELTFIGAELDDWPWQLYERLGFDPIGIETTFIRRRSRP